MSEKLTPQQKMAVENRGGKLLVSAAAGSGKTKVLVDRLMSYLTDSLKPANLDEFLIITYTNAAAAELRGKIADKLTNYIAEHPENRHMHRQIQNLHLAKICTVHAFCADVLREYAYRLDISSDFRIAEENECQEMMFEVLQELLEEAYAEDIQDAAFRAFVDTQGLGRDDRQISEIILQIYSSALCHLDPDGWLNWCLEASNTDSMEDVGNTVWGDYLIQDLKSFVLSQITSLENCINSAAGDPSFAKPVSLLKSTVNSLKSLYSCTTWDEIVNHPPVEYGTLTFSKESKGTLLSEQMKAIRNACKENLAKKLRTFSDDSETMLSQLEDSSLAAEGLVALVKAFKSRFDRMKRIRKVLDFSDVEQCMLDLLYGKRRTGPTAAAEEIGSRFVEIMVDEYQDSNAVQNAIFSALTEKRKNCFMVGDVKQSIYRFRLADPEIFLKKYNSYADAEIAQPGENRKVLLSSNFRSSAGVISAVNDVFMECMSPKVGGLNYTESEMLREGIPHIPLPDPEVELYGIDVDDDTYQEEAAFVARRINQLLDGKHMVRDGDALRPIVADDIVILLRSPGSVGGEFRYALECAGIPCTMGSDIDLLLAPEVETLRAILQVIHNPLQDIPLIAALSSPVFGFTADELAAIRSDNRYASFYQAVAECKTEKASSFLQTLNALRKDARFLTVTELIYRIFLRTKMLSIYGAMPEGEKQVENLQNFCQIAAGFEATGRKDLTYFLSYLSAMDERGLSIPGATPEGAVRIMSIHKSKGLEFPVVFLCGLSRVFNMSDCQKQVLCHKDLGLGLVHTNVAQRVSYPTIAKRAISAKLREETIAEELRVLYVAMTRARDRLIMTYAAQKLEDRLNDIALRIDLSHKELMRANVSCPGSWILLSALQRTEAGQFFAISQKPDCSCVREIPWSIHVTAAIAADYVAQNEEREVTELSGEIIEKIRMGLNFRYCHTDATMIPSKLTATQLKGRAKDMEAAENAGAINRQLEFRNPSDGKRQLFGADLGNAVHHVMQYLDLTKTGSCEKISAELSRLLEAKLINRQQAEAVDTGKILRFFETPIGKRMITCKELLREFKFSVLVDAGQYYPGVKNEHVLLQGVIDCALIEDGGITILDFKTDRITDENRSLKIQQYRGQIETYAQALSAIYEKPVLDSYIYFFHSEELIAL